MTVTFRFETVCSRKLIIYLSITGQNLQQLFKHSMKALKSKHFSVVLQVAAFFKFHNKWIEQEISEGVRLMGVEQLYLNIVNDKFQTTIMKDIIIFLLAKIYNPKFAKHHEAGSNHFLVGQLQTQRGSIIQHYYMQMALEQYFYLAEQQHEHEQYAKIYNFYELKEQMKFKVLSKLVSNASENISRELSKKKKQMDKDKQKQGESEEHKNQGKDKKIIIEEIVVLGQDNKYVYFFVPFLPEYVLTYYMGTWQGLDKNKTIKILQKILQQPISSNNIFLCQSLSKVISKFMTDAPQKQPSIKLHKIKQNRLKMSQERVKYFKNKLLQINERYSKYLYNFKNRCWGYFKVRQNYVDSLKKAEHIDQLIQAFKLFYLTSCSKIYICQCDDQRQIPQDTHQQFYKTEVRTFCNINTVTNKINSHIALSSSQISLKIIEQQHADLYALFQLNICLLLKSVEYLEEKQRKYQMKQQKLIATKSSIEQSIVDEVQGKNSRILRKKVKSVRYSNQNSRSSLSSLSSIKTKQQKSTIELRQRKKKSTKKFGVTMIDSDESSEQSQNEKQIKVNKSFDEYHYKQSKASVK